MKVLVTGANGFVGTALVHRLIDEGWEVAGTFRNENASMGGAEVAPFITGDINGKTDWSKVARDVDTVIHTAGRAHIMDDTAEDRLAAYRRVNVQGTENLARQAAEAGVRRFIFLSSVKVNGESRQVAYKESDKPSPKDSYGISKMEAELALLKIAAESGMEIVTLRPPLVYGPQVKANFLRLLKIVNRGLPLPLGSIHNERSLVFVDNLVDAIVTCIRHPHAVGKTYLLRDEENVSTPILIHMLAKALGKSIKLFRCPPFVMDIAARLLGQRLALDRLLGSLTVDDSKIRHELAWRPPIKLNEGLKKTADWFKSSRSYC